MQDCLVNRHQQQGHHNHLHHHPTSQSHSLATQHQAYQSVVNRYATIGRNLQQYKAPPVPSKLEMDLQSTLGRAAPPPPLGVKQSHLNKVNARIVNHNLTQHLVKPHKKGHKDKREQNNGAKASLPLADVRLIANKKVKDPFEKATRGFPDDIKQERSQRADTSCYGRLRLIEKAKADDDSEDANVDSDLGLEEDEEEKVKRKTSFPTILMPRPIRKPPFTIERAMSSILRRKKKESGSDPDSELPDLEHPPESVDKEKATAPKPKKKTSFTFAKLKANLISSGNLDNDANISVDVHNDNEECPITAICQSGERSAARYELFGVSIFFFPSEIVLFSANSHLWNVEGR